MGAKSKIEWTDSTWPVTRGCDLESPGCKNCYAMFDTNRFKGEGLYGEGFVETRETTTHTKRGERVRLALPVWTGRVAVLPENLAMPLTWSRARTIFVNATSDLFHEDVPFEFIAAVFGVTLVAKHHRFLILTKRAARMAEFFRWLYAQGDPAYVVLDFAHRHILAASMCIDGPKYTKAIKGRFEEAFGAARAGRLAWPNVNVMCGVSVENQRYADERIPHLLKTPFKRFLSIEPQLDEVTLRPWLFALDEPPCECGSSRPWCVRDGFVMCPACERVRRRHDSAQIHWIIVGGESGRYARPYRTTWAHLLLWEAREAGVAIFVKQLGQFPRAEASELHGRVEGQGKVLITHTDGAWWSLSLHHARGGDPAEWPADLNVREPPPWDLAA